MKKGAQGEKAQPNLYKKKKDNSLHLSIISY